MMTRDFVYDSTRHRAMGIRECFPAGSQVIVKGHSDNHGSLRLIHHEIIIGRLEKEPGQLLSLSPDRLYILLSNAFHRFHLDLSGRLAAPGK